MYIELFLADNLLLNLLIVRLAAAMLSVRPPLHRAIGCSALAAVIAALAAFRFPLLQSPIFRAPLLFLMALALPFRGIRAFFRAALAVLAATLTVGGCALAVACLSGGGTVYGGVRGGITIRAAMITAICASLLPRAAGRLLRRRVQNGFTAKVVILHGGFVRRFTALVDTGNTLREPVSGLPVAVVHCRALEKYAVLPVSVHTAAGRAELKGFFPEKISVDGVETACFVALTRERLCEEALIPPEICPARK